MTKRPAEVMISLRYRCRHTVRTGALPTRSRFTADEAEAAMKDLFRGEDCPDCRLQAALDRAGSEKGRGGAPGAK